MATQTQTQTTLLQALAPEMKTYYEKRLLDNAQPELVHDQFGEKYTIPEHAGKTMELRKFSPLGKATTPLTEGVPPSGNSLTVTNLTATIAQYGDYIKMSDVLDMTAYDNVKEQATKELGREAGLTMDTITREVITGGTSKMFVPSVSNGTETPVLLRANVTAACALRPADILKAVTKLKRVNCKPINGGYVGIIHPDTEHDIMANDDWLDVHKYAKPEEIYNGEIGKLYGVRFVSTSEAKIIGPQEILEGIPRLTLKTALDGTGATDIVVDEAISAAQVAALTAAVDDGTITKIYVGGKEATLASTPAVAGAAGAAKLCVSAAVKSVAAGAVVCGQGAGKDGSAIYCTMIIGQGAYATTTLGGKDVEFILKPSGSAGTADPLNQVSTAGWKAIKAALRLNELHMVRIEHGNSTFGQIAVSN